MPWPEEIFAELITLENQSALAMRRKKQPTDSQPGRFYQLCRHGGGRKLVRKRRRLLRRRGAVLWFGGLQQSVDVTLENTCKKGGRIDPAPRGGVCPIREETHESFLRFT